MVDNVSRIIWQLLVDVDTNTICEPSGDHAGMESPVPARGYIVNAPVLTSNRAMS